MDSTASPRPMAIVGANRNPFCRAHTAYGRLTNLDMLSATLQGVVDRTSWPAPEPALPGTCPAG